MTSHFPVTVLVLVCLKFEIPLVEEPHKKQDRKTMTGTTDMGKVYHGQ